jgi:hypothetical protein
MQAQAIHRLALRGGSLNMIGRDRSRGTMLLGIEAPQLQREGFSPSRIRIVCCRVNGWNGEWQL